MEKNTLTLADKSKEEYIHQIQSKPNKIIKAATTITTMSTMTLKKRWALKKRRTVKRFLSNQTSFLRDAFIQGEITGHKCDPEEVAAKMRTARNNGCRLFSKHEFLSSNQIASYFSRMSFVKKIENTQNLFEEKDVQAEEYENVLSDLKKNLYLRNDQSCKIIAANSC